MAELRIADCGLRIDKTRQGETQSSRDSFRAFVIPASIRVIGEIRGPSAIDLFRSSYFIKTE